MTSASSAGIRRRRALCRFAPVTLPLLLAGLLSARSAAAAPLTYADNLGAALAFMEHAKQPQALVPLRSALTEGPSAFHGRAALGALYLQSGSAALAAREFERAKAAAPAGDPLAAWGAALAALAQGKADPETFARFAADPGVPDDVRAVAPTLALYVRVLRGDAAAVRRETVEVTPTEPDLLRLEVAAFAAIRGGDPARGESLLAALLKRPEMKKLAEDPALELTFDPARPASGEAPSLPAALPPADTPKAGATFCGSTVLTPPAGLPPAAAYVTYSLDGGAFSATTNNAPFTFDWNTARIPNGSYTLRTSVYDAEHRLIKSAVRVVRLENGGDAPPAPDLLTEAEAGSLRDRLWAQLLPRPCRKAAHFALAEQAVQTGDTLTALAEIESVCAIDPGFRGAYDSLRHFYREVLGPRDGIWQARTAEKIVALTFDDGPNPAQNRTPALLDALDAVDAQATFFVVGWRAEQAPELLQRMIEGGHEIGNHTYSHLNLTYLKELDVERELCRTSVIVRDATGRRPRFYRPPGGNFNHGVVQAAEALGMSGAYWTVDGVKIEESPKGTPDQLTKFVLSRVRPGAIVLLHNAPTVTIEAIPAIVRGLRAKGYTLVTMTDLVQRSRRSGGAPAAVATAPAAKPEVSRSAHR